MPDASDTPDAREKPAASGPDNRNSTVEWNDEAMQTTFANVEIGRASCRERV